ncbi:MAG TPA: DUF2239 family protein [Allosphingosinicella sp.]|nr:DUF2239 family protein [Allosphingosinicella sp.]
MDQVTAFLGDEAIARGPRGEVTRLIEARWPASDHSAIRAYDDATGRVVDLDYRGAGAGAELAPRGRGRPKLGVVAREVTLLPRQWDWLSRQRGGASAALRRLVDEAGKAVPSPEARRDAAYRFMSDRCGDRPGYEEALRALYRGDGERLEALVAPWPDDIRAYLFRLLG